jgi:hypothetical protein
MCNIATMVSSNSWSERLEFASDQFSNNNVNGQISPYWTLNQRSDFNKILLQPNGRLRLFRIKKAEIVNAINASGFQYILLTLRLNQYLIYQLKLGTLLKLYYILGAVLSFPNKICMWLFVAP